MLQKRTTEGPGVMLQRNVQTVPYLPLHKGCARAWGYFPNSMRRKWREEWSYRFRPLSKYFLAHANQIELAFLRSSHKFFNVQTSFQVSMSRCWSFPLLGKHKLGYLSLAPLTFLALPFLKKELHFSSICRIIRFCRMKWAIQWLVILWRTDCTSCSMPAKDSIKEV